MYYSQPNSNSNFATIVFIVLLLIGTGLLIYYSIDITTENKQLEQSVVNLRAELTTRNSEAKALRDEITTCTLANSSLTEQSTRLQGELDQVLKDYAAIQTYVTELEKSQAEPLQQENDNLQIALDQRTTAKTSQEILQASILPTDLTTWMMIAAVLLIGAVVLVTSIYTARHKKPSVLDRLYAEQGLSHKHRNTDVIVTRLIKR